VSTQELIEKEIADLPESLQRRVYDFIRSLRTQKENKTFNGLLLSESALAKDWETPEEDAAWASL
jgi:DNA replication initiation complex subunit (GINS family)